MKQAMAGHTAHRLQLHGLKMMNYIALSIFSETETYFRVLYCSPNATEKSHQSHSSDLSKVLCILSIWGIQCFKGKQRTSCSQVSTQCKAT